MQTLKLVNMEKQKAIEVLTAAGLWPNEARFHYMMLARMQEDCKYFLGFGGRNPRALWVGEVARHIEIMRALYAILPETPEWISARVIDELAEDMARPTYKLIREHKSGLCVVICTGMTKEQADLQLEVTRQGTGMNEYNYKIVAE